MPKRTFLIVIAVIALLTAAYFIADRLLFDGIRAQEIDQEGFKGNYYAASNPEKRVAVLLVGGGAWGDYWGAELAKKGFAGLSLPYSGAEGLPPLPEEIPLEYFQKALQWLATRPEVDAGKLVVMGASRNAELALVIAAHYPELVKGVIAYSPSAVAWSNTVLPYNSDERKASWTFQGKDVPYLPMDKIAPPTQGKVNTLAYWQQGLNKIEAVEKAFIAVEKIDGPILLLSGEADQVWPSAQMADMIEQRLKAYGQEDKVENIQYPEAGHLIASNPEAETESRSAQMTIEGQSYEFDYGGTEEGDFAAKQDAQRRVWEFMAKF